MIVEKKYRYENKYRLYLDEWNKLKHDLLFTMPLDSNIINGEGYIVTSVYFDNIDEEIYTEKLEGFELREKLRIRCYNHLSSDIKFEIKGKNANGTYKQIVSLSIDEYDEIVQGKYDSLLTKGIIGEKIYWKLVTTLVKPIVVVEYNRIAFTIPLMDIRISVDTYLRAHRNEKGIFEDTPTNDLLDRGMVVLEIKGSEEIPRYIKDVLKQCGATQTENSKYALAIERLIKGEWELW